MKLISQIFRSAKKEGAYLYVAKDHDLDSLPDVLKNLFGKPELAMTLVLTPDRKLAHSDAPKVIAAIEEQGFYLQMPPTADSAMSKVSLQNSKLPRA